VGGAWMPVDESAFIEKTDGSKSYVRISDNKVLKAEGPKNFDMTIVQSETTEVTIGFVANIGMINNNSKGGNVDISNISIERQQ